MRCEITLDQLQTQAALAMDFASSLPRPLLGPERDTFRWLLVASKCATVVCAVKKLNAANRSSHHRMVERLQKLINPDPHEVLGQLDSQTRNFLDYATGLGRPLRKSERQAWGWILKEWDSRAIKPALMASSEARRDEIELLLARLRQVIAPDPPRERHFQYEKDVAVAELNAGNFSLKKPLYSGVNPARLTQREATELVESLAHSCSGIAVQASLLALVRHRDRDEAASMKRLARHVRKLARGFWERFSAIQDIPDDQRKSVKTLADGISEHLTRLAAQIALINQMDQREVKRLTQAAQRMTKLGLAFVERCRAAPEIAPERDLDEILADARYMAELMKPDAES